jgi:CRP-like cAMP-binding protein
MTNKRQDASFYTYDSGTQAVWEEVGNPFYVVRCGEMRIHAVNDNGSDVVIRYTDQLEDFGVKTDEDLNEWSAKGEEVFEWVNNPWFEVYTDEDPDFPSGVYDTLDDAIEFAKWANAHPEEARG